MVSQLKKPLFEYRLLLSLRIRTDGLNLKSNKDQGMLILAPIYYQSSYSGINVLLKY